MIHDSTPYRHQLTLDLRRLADAITGDRALPDTAALAALLGLTEQDRARDDVARRAAWVIRMLAWRLAAPGQRITPDPVAALPTDRSGLWLVIGWCAGVAATSYGPEDPESTDEAAHAALGDRFLDVLRIAESVGPRRTGGQDSR